MQPKKKGNINYNQIYAVLHQLLMAVYGFGLLLILYRVTTKAETGRWLLFVSAVSLLDMLMHGFLQTPVIRKIAMERTNKKGVDHIASNALFFSLAIWAVVSLIIITGSFIFPQVQLLHDLRWYTVLGLSMVFYNVSWWIGNALLEFRIVLYQRLLFTVFSVSVVLFILLTRHQLQTDHIILAQFAGYALSSVCMFAFVRKLKISWKYIQQTHFRYFFDYGKFTSGSMIMGSLLRNADIFMIAAFLNQGAVAIYSAAQKTVEIFEVALRGMASHALPEFCKCANDFNLMMKKYVKASSMLLLGFMPLALLMSIFSEHIIKLLSGSAEYSGASTLLRIFMIYVLFLVVDRMTGIVLEAFGLARYNLAKTTLLVIVNVTGNAIALFCFHSLAGVAVVSIIAAVTGIISGMYFIMIHTGFSLSKQSIRNGFNYALR